MLFWYTIRRRLVCDVSCFVKFWESVLKKFWWNWVILYLFCSQVVASMCLIHLIYFTASMSFVFVSGLQSDDHGHFGVSSPTQSRSGYVVHIKPSPYDSSTHECLIPPSHIPTEKWIAIFAKTKDNCKVTKLLNLPYLKNATAVVVYGRNDIAEQDIPGKKSKGLLKL